MVHHDSRDARRRAVFSHGSRRRFLAASGTGLLGLPGNFAVRPALSAEAESSGASGTAKATIMIVLAGGASHLDTWDMKPEAPAEIRGEFQPIETSAPGVRLCEHLPMTARHAHRLAVINSVEGTDPTNSHLGYYYHLIGHMLDPRTIIDPAQRRQLYYDWPLFGHVVSAYHLY